MKIGKKLATIGCHYGVMMDIDTPYNKSGAYDWEQFRRLEEMTFRLGRVMNNVIGYFVEREKNPTTLW